MYFKEKNKIKVKMASKSKSKKGSEKTEKKEKKENPYEGQNVFHYLQTNEPISKENLDAFKRQTIKQLDREINTIIVMTKKFAKLNSKDKSISHEGTEFTHDQYKQIIRYHKDHIKTLVRKQIKKYREKLRPFFSITSEFQQFLQHAFSSDAKFKAAVSQFAKEKKIPKILITQIIYHYIGSNELRENPGKLTKTTFHPSEDMLKYMPKTMERLHASLVKDEKMEAGKLNKNTKFPHFSVFSITSMLGERIELDDEEFEKYMKTFGDSIAKTSGLIQDAKHERSERAKEARDSGKESNSKKKKKPAKEEAEEPEEDEEAEEHEEKPPKKTGGRVATTPPAHRKRQQAQSDDESE